MFSQLRPAIVSLTLLTLITGLVYPAIVTGVAKVAFADKATGSIITINGKAIGSELIGRMGCGPDGGHYRNRLAPLSSL